MDLFSNPQHPYTKALMASVPSIDDDGSTTLNSINGTVSSDYDALKGCRFYDRCPYAQDACQTTIDMRQYGSNHRVRCIDLGRNPYE